LLRNFSFLYASAVALFAGFSAPVRQSNLAVACVAAAFAVADVDVLVLSVAKPNERIFLSRFAVDDDGDCYSAVANTRTQFGLVVLKETLLTFLDLATTMTQGHPASYLFLDPLKTIMYCRAISVFCSLLRNATLFIPSWNVGSGLR